MSLFGRVTDNRSNNGRGSSPNVTNNQGNRQVCPFFLQGRCRFGADCRNYHPPRDSSSTSNSNNPSSTRNSQQLPYGLNADYLKADLTPGDEKPVWPLSCYAAARDTPRQLLEGAIEQSPEELRVQYYLAAAQGNTQPYEQNERAALAEADAQVQRILHDVEGALKFVIDGKDVHPNRDDGVFKGSGNFVWKERPGNAAAASGGTFGQPSSSGFGSAAGPVGQGSTFGQQPTFGASPSAPSPFGGGKAPTTGSGFGQPSAMGGGSAFGQPSKLGGGSAFGQPSTLGGGNAFGQKAAPAFGVPSAPTSAFGQPSSLGAAGGAGASAFGQTSTLGGGNTPFGGANNSTNTQGSAFGQASTLGGSSSTFGRPSSFGAAATLTSGATPAFGSATPFGASSSQPAASGTSTFGQPSNPGAPSNFGQPSNAGAQSTFGQPSNAGAQSTFGQLSAPAQQGSAFGQASNNSAFAQPSPFANTTGAGNSTFGQPSRPSFGSASTFGATAAPNGSTSTFGSNHNNNNNQASPSPFATASKTTTSSTSTFGAPQPQPQSQPGIPLTHFKSQPITTTNGQSFYANPAQNGRQERLWFPEGAPGPNPDVEAEDTRVYLEDGTASAGMVLRQIYEFVRERGVFRDGFVPEVPPRREWVSFEL